MRKQTSFFANLLWNGDLTLGRDSHRILTPQSKNITRQVLQAQRVSMPEG
jgi:hypothetical protein